MSLSSRQGKQLVIARLCEFISHCPENKTSNTNSLINNSGFIFAMANAKNFQFDKLIKFFHLSNRFHTV